MWTMKSQADQNSKANGLQKSQLPAQSHSSRSHRDQNAKDGDDTVQGEEDVSVADEDHRGRHGHREER